MTTAAPAGSRVFYGWIVLAASVAVIAVGTGTIFSLAVFLRPLEEEFGWTRSLISGIALVNWVIFGVGSFAWGALSDRIGARRVVGTGAGILGAALVLSSQIRSATAALRGVRGPRRDRRQRLLRPARGNGHALVRGPAGPGHGHHLRGHGARHLPGPALLPAPSSARLGWRTAFALFGALAWTVGLVAVRYLVDRPEDRGLRSYGRHPRAARASRRRRRA